MVGAGFRDAVRQRARRWTALVVEAEPSAAVTGLGRRRASYGSGGETSRCGRQPLAPYSGQVDAKQEPAALSDQACGRRWLAAGRVGRQRGEAQTSNGQERLTAKLLFRLPSRSTNQELRSEAPSASEVEERAGWTGRAGVEHALSPALSGKRRGHARASVRRGATPPTRDRRESTGGPTVEVSNPPTESLTWRKAFRRTLPRRSSPPRQRRSSATAWLISWSVLAQVRERSLALLSGLLVIEAFQTRSRACPLKCSTSASDICGILTHTCVDSLDYRPNSHQVFFTVDDQVEQVAECRRALCCLLFSFSDNLPHPRLLLGRERRGDGSVQLAAGLVDGGGHGRAPAGRRPTSRALGRVGKAVRVEPLGGARS